MESKVTKSLSPRQREVLDFITQSQHQEHRMPSYREIAKALKVSAVGTIQDHIRVLVEKGYLQRQGKELKLAENRTCAMLTVPILGQVSAGALQDAFEVSLGTLSFTPDLDPKKSGRTQDPRSYFALKVKGESMIDAGILDGDFVIVNRNVKAKNGDIVVAGTPHEATVKELRINGSHVELIPHNKKLKPIKVEPHQEFQIFGKVVGLQRRL